MASLPGFPGLPGLPTSQPPLPSGPNDGSGNEAQPTSIKIVNRTMVTSITGTIPPTTAGNTLVACIVSTNGGRGFVSGQIYLNSTGTSIGTDPILNTTVYDGTPFYFANDGPVNQADHYPGTGSNVQSTGVLIGYLENIPGGVTQISFFGATTSDIRLAVYELTPCTFDVAGIANAQSSGGGVTTWAGTITTTAANAIAFGVITFQQASIGTVTGFSWPVDLVAPAWGTSFDVERGFVCVNNGITGTTLVTFIASGSTFPHTGMFLACFKPASYAIALLERKTSFSASGGLSIRTTDPGDLVVVIASSGASVSGGSDAFILAGSTANFCLFYCMSVGGTSSITFSSAGGILVYELSPPTGFAFTLLDTRSATSSPTALTLHNTSGIQYAGPTLTGDTGNCAYILIGDDDTGTADHYLLSYDWRRDPDFIGVRTVHCAATYTALNLSGAQQMSFYARLSLVGADPIGMIGIAIGLDAIVASDDDGGIDLNTFLPNVWIVC